MSNSTHFAERLAALRQAAGLSQYELARRTGLTRQTVSRLEMGDREPGWDTVQLIAQVLGVTCSEFLNPGIAPPEIEEPRPRGRPAKTSGAAQDERGARTEADTPAKGKKPGKGKQTKRKGG